MVLVNSLFVKAHGSCVLKINQVDTWKHRVDESIPRKRSTMHAQNTIVTQANCFCEAAYYLCQLRNSYDVRSAQNKGSCNYLVTSPNTKPFPEQQKAIEAS